MSSPRTELFKRLENIAALQKDNPSSYNEMSLVVVDITHFSMLNLHLGEQTSNAILDAVESRLKSQPWAYFATRLSSDEYAIIVKNGVLMHSVINQPLLSQADCNVAFMRISEAFEQAFNGMRLCFSGGLAPFSNQEMPHQWLAQAFVALREAKSKRLINRGVIYQPIHLALVGSAMSDSDTFHAVNDGLKEQSFILHFQPQWTMVSHDQFKLVGVEALVRGQRNGNIVGPNQFIGVAEQSGSIVMLGQQVIEMSCKARATLGFKEDHVLSWNVSPVQIEMDHNLLALIEFSVQNFGLERQQVAIEITESEMLNSSSVVFLEKLVELGYKIAIDDFGTEHAALSMLTKLKADTIKIDRSFLVGVPNDSRKTTMFKDLLSMLHNQNINIIVEGVETKAQVNFLYEQQQKTRTLILQGYYLGRPMNYESIQKLLKDENLKTYNGQ